MNPWAETIAVTGIAFLGFLLGKRFSTLKGPRWSLGYFLGLVLIGLLVLTRFSNYFLFTPPFCWLATGRTRFVVLALAVTTGLASPLSRLPYRFEKIAVYILMVVVVFWSSVLPFLFPALIKDELLKTETLIDSKGICYQTKNYTCAAAAAVTALHRLGLDAQEGRIAVLAHTSPVIGTLPKSLCKALKTSYQKQGLQCTWRQFDSVEELKNSGIILAVVKDSFLTDHCVAVLDVSDSTVSIADPVDGKKELSHRQFEKMWRFSGIVLKRNPLEKI
jgi:hypothetical protein